MNRLFLIATILVTLALVSYTIFAFSRKYRKPLGAFSVAALSFGLLLDLSATILMIVGSRNKGITFHGVLGYSALAGMLVDTVLIWRHWRGKQKAEPVSRAVFRYTWIAYSWWILAFIAGAALASGRLH